MREWIGPTISGAAALTSVAFSIITRFEVRRQQRLQFFGLRRQYDADLRAWANSTLAALTEAIGLTFHTTDSIEAEVFARRREDVLTRLSTLADAGRWFFPNEPSASHGSSNPTAYRGFRPAILDCVVDAFNALRGLRGATADAQVRESLVDHRRAFVSYVQERLDPRAREAELTTLLD